jgi:hypothetical protein
MSEERLLLLQRINDLIDKRKLDLLQRVPYIHEFEGGVIIQYFTDWSDLFDNIKYKRIVNQINNNDITTIYYLPKGVVFKLHDFDKITDIICVTGEVVINNDITLKPSTKLSLKNDEIILKCIEDSYVITLNNNLPVT